MCKVDILPKFQLAVAVAPHVALLLRAALGDITNVTNASTEPAAVPADRLANRPAALPARQAPHAAKQAETAAAKRAEKAAAAERKRAALAAAAQLCQDIAAARTADLAQRQQAAVARATAA